MYRFSALFLGEDKDSLSISRYANIVVCSAGSRHRNLLVTATSLDPSRPLPLTTICETCTWPLRSCSDLSYGGDVLFLQTTGQCTCVKVPEVLCQFVQSSATRARLGRCSSGTCRLLFRSLRKVIFLMKLSCRNFRMLWSWSFPPACHWIGHRNTS